MAMKQQTFLVQEASGSTEKRKRLEVALSGANRGPSCLAPLLQDVPEVQLARPCRPHSPQPQKLRVFLSHQ